jgi:nucleotide-binding universal stress UspA family protein
MPETAASLRPALELADRLGASVDLLYVVSHTHPVIRQRGSIGAPSYVDQPQHEWPQWANEMINHLLAFGGTRPSNVPFRAFLAHGDIGAEITHFAATHQVDAVALVRSSNLELDRAEVLRAVLYTTPCPALLIGRTATSKMN